MKAVLGLALFTLAGGCSLLSDVSDLAFDDDVDTNTGPDGDTDSDSDGDTDSDSDSDSDTWPPGSCANPHEVGDTLPYFAEHDLAGLPDAFDNLCMTDCCGGEPERVYHFVAPWDGEYVVQVEPNMYPAYYMVGVLAHACGDAEWCAAQSGGGIEERSREAIGFYGMSGTDYYIVVQSMDGGYLDYWIEIREGGIVEEFGTCDYPYDLGAPPNAVDATTLDQPNSFTQICGSSCCDGAEFVFLFEPPQTATYQFTLTNQGIAGPATLAMLDMCMDDYPCLTDGAGANGFGNTLSLTKQLAQFQTVYLVVQGAWGDGVFSLGVEQIAQPGAGTCEDPYIVGIDGGSWIHSDTTQGKNPNVLDYSPCSVDNPVMEQFPGPEAVYRLETPMPETYLIDATFDGGTSGVLASMSLCADPTSCFDAMGSQDGVAHLMLEADFSSSYFIVVDRNPPGPYALTVTPCSLAPCSGTVVDDCCPFECGIEFDQDCCNLAPCGDMGNDGCCPEGCTAVLDPDC
jgi:hypothetical protein